MSPRRNYGFEKRRREDERKAKQQQKLARKAERAESGAVGPDMGEPQETGAPSGLWEWFSPSRSRTITTPPKQRPPGDAPDDWMLLTDVADAEDGPERPNE